MDAKPQQLHAVFFPFMAHGHMIPTLDIARLFQSRGAKATIITTPLNALIFTKAIEKAKKTINPVIDIKVFRFPAQEAGLPEGCENLEQVTGTDKLDKFTVATELLLRDQLEHYLQKTQPSCLVADMMFSWAIDSAAKFHTPSLVFHGTGFFYLCGSEVVQQYEPYKNVSSDEEPFALPSLPHDIKMTRLQFPEDIWKYKESVWKRKLKQIREAELNSYGVIVNSFYELEPDYADFFRNEMGRRAWHIGPVSLCNRSTKDKAQRGKQAAIDEHKCLRWLDSRKPNSVIYICFGSTGKATGPQLKEIAMALEASDQAFIWVVKSQDCQLPPGFEQRIEGKALIIKGWAPQVLILEHEAIGAFVTHCGWNSTLEAISAGKPMVTWPVFAEQFYNEKLVTQILKIGVPVGSQKWSKTFTTDYMVKQETIEQALRNIMVGDGAEEMRNRAKSLKEMAWKAVEEGGSSHCNFSSLINDLTVCNTGMLNA